MSNACGFARTRKCKMPVGLKTHKRPVYIYTKCQMPVGLPALQGVVETNDRCIIIWNYSEWQK